MSFYPNNDEYVILGYIQKKEPVMIDNHPRIFLGYKVNNTIYKLGIGISSIKINKKYFFERKLFNINYEISECEINTNYMVKRDIDFYNELIKKV